MSTYVAVDYKLHINRIGGGLLLALIASFFFTRPPAPPLQSVNGLYFNSCCLPIRLHNGVLIGYNIRVPFKLLNMKFGLVAQPAHSIRVGADYSLLKTPAPIPDYPFFEAAQGADYIAFDNDHKGFTLPRGSALFDFRLTQSDR